MADDEVERRAAAKPPERPIEEWSHDELEKLVTGFSPSAPPAIHAANRLIGAADELGRLIMSFVLGLVILIVLAALLTPWLWLAAGAWLVLGAATIAWMVRRQRVRDTGRPGGRVIEPPGPRR